MGRARKASAKQRNYIKVLAERVGSRAAREASRKVVRDPLTGKGVDVFAPAPNQPYPWSKEMMLDHIAAADATDLIDALRKLPRQRKQHVIYRR